MIAGFWNVTSDVEQKYPERQQYYYAYLNLKLKTNTYISISIPKCYCLLKFDNADNLLCLIVSWRQSGREIYSVNAWHFLRSYHCNVIFL